MALYLLYFGTTGFFIFKLLLFFCFCFCAFLGCFYFWWHFFSFLGCTFRIFLFSSFSFFFFKFFSLQISNQILIFFLVSAGNIISDLQPSTLIHHQNTAPNPISYSHTITINYLFLALRNIYFYVYVRRSSLGLRSRFGCLKSFTFTLELIIGKPTIYTLVFDREYKANQSETNHLPLYAHDLH